MSAGESRTPTEHSTRPLAFTVFTPTFQRAGTLHRVYDSLCDQTRRDFEWVIVDDGSTDGTSELVSSWASKADFPVRYLWQENSGKHWAHNRGVAEARGDLFLCLDSDDACVPTALERLSAHWEAIPAGARHSYAGVGALCMDEAGKVVGTPYPQDVIDSDYNEIRYRFGVQGEKWGCVRTDVLRQFPFPQVLKREYLPEGIVWSAISRKYKFRFVNEALRVYHTGHPSLVHTSSPARNSAGGRLQHLAALNDEIDYFPRAPWSFLRSSVHYARFGFHLGLSPVAQFRDLQRPLARLLWAAAIAPGYLVFGMDRFKDRFARARGDR